MVCVDEKKGYVRGNLPVVIFTARNSDEDTGK